MRGPVAENAINARRPAHRPTRVSPDRIVKPRISRHSSPGTGRRAAAVLVAVAAGVVGRVEVHPVARCHFPVGELRGFCLAHEHEPAGEQPLHRRRHLLLRRVQRPVRAAATTRTQTLHVVDVLHGNAQTCKGLFGRRGEVKTRGNTDGLCGSTRDLD